MTRCLVLPLSAGATVQPFHRAAQNRHDGAWGRTDVIDLRPDFCFSPGADICRVARDLQNCAAQADLLADFRLLRATQYPYQRVVWAALIAFAGIWREISQLIRLSFPFF